MYTDPHLLKTAANALKNAKDIEYIVYNDMSNTPYSEKDVEMFKTNHPQYKIISFEELRKLGEDNPIPPMLPSSEDLYCIMYTSGTTGPPKASSSTFLPFFRLAANICCCCLLGSAIFSRKFCGCWYAVFGAPPFARLPTWC